MTRSPIASINARSLEFITDAVNRYINMHRPILYRGNAGQSALWISSTTGRR